MKIIDAGYRDCLNSLNQVPGIIGGIILQKNGDLVCHTFEKPELLDKISRLTLDYLKLMHLLMREGRTGHCHNVSIKGAFGVVDLHIENSRKLVTAILGTESMNIGLLRATLDEEFGNIDDLGRANTRTGTN